MQLLTRELLARLPIKRKRGSPYAFARFIPGPGAHITPDWEFFVLEGNAIINRAGRLDYEIRGWHCTKQWCRELHVPLSFLEDVRRSSPLAAGEIIADVSFCPRTLNELKLCERR